VGEVSAQWSYNPIACTIFSKHALKGCAWARGYQLSFSADKKRKQLLHVVCTLASEHQTTLPKDGGQD
jgi:hypothetical protein